MVYKKLYSLICDFQKYFLLTLFAASVIIVICMLQ